MKTFAKILLPLAFSLAAFAQNPPGPFFSGPAANKPATCDVAGDNYFTTDTQILYGCAPPNWYPINSGGTPGNVSASGSFTVGHVVVANNTSGTSVIDGGAPGSTVSVTSANGGISINPSPGTGTFTVDLANVAATSHKWFNSVVSGVLTATQPAASDLSNGTTGSGAVVLATSPTLVTPALGTIASGVGTALTALNASNLSSGTVPSAQLPTFTPPYLLLGTCYALTTDNGYCATKPSFSGWSTLTGSPGTITTGSALTNGDYYITNSSSSNEGFIAQAASVASGIEIVFQANSIAAGSLSDPFTGVFLYDSTNGKLIVCQGYTTTGMAAALYTYTYNGSTAPASATLIDTTAWLGLGVYHLKLSYASTTATCAISVNGGINYQTIGTQTVGTIAKSGILTYGNVSVYSLKVQ